MALNQGDQPVHRPGPLKQSNKKHKGGKSGTSLAKGRMDIKAISHASRHNLNRKDRKHKASQMRKNKREAVLLKKRGLKSTSFPPILTAIISLGHSLDPCAFLERIKQCDSMNEAAYDEFGNCHVNFMRQRERFTFVIPNANDVHAVMDVAKVADRILFLHSVEAFDDYTEMLLSTILAHALPANVHVIQGLHGLSQKKKSEVRKEVFKKIESRFPDAKLLHCDTEQELQLLLRHIACQKEVSVGFRDVRPHLIAEKVSFEEDNSDTKTGTLKVSGYIRGKNLNVNRLVHLPGWGTFQMSQIVYENGSHFFHSKRNSSGISEEVTMSENLIDKADANIQESLQDENIPEFMEDDVLSLSEDNPDDEPRRIAKRVVEGTSEYQAAWIIDNKDIDGEDDDNSESDDSVVTAPDTFPDQEDMDLEKNSTDNEDEYYDLPNDDLESEGASQENGDPSDYDKDINMEEERKMLVRFREERMEQMFPDERDTAVDMPARIRYQKYRGLKSFTETPWDPKENLPREYSRIYCFENFRLARKKVFYTDTEGAVPGSYVTVYIACVPKSLFDSTEESKSLVVYGLLPHEQKMSVVNVVIKKHPSCKTPIQSKDRLIFHIGFRRFVCQPIFSMHGTGNKFKYEKFLPSSTSVVATFFAPVTFPSASVVVFQQQTNGQAELVATGSLMNADPNRVIVKRIVLSGHPFKIARKSAVVRYMFFNRDDINWFKKIELRTKSGRRGHIKEALGSHGHMKCVFDRQLQSQDSVLMSLYKRVFPKWTFEPTVPTFTSPSDAKEYMFL